MSAFIFFYSPPFLFKPSYFKGTVTPLKRLNTLTTQMVTGFKGLTDESRSFEDSQSRSLNSADSNLAF